MVVVLRSARHQGINFPFQFGAVAPMLLLVPEIFLLLPGFYSSPVRGSISPAGRRWLLLL
jgi:hypothetical protein